MARSGCVFVLSTTNDLDEYRRAAQDAVLEVGLRPEAMEYFSASGLPPLSECLKRVSSCDLVIVIVAHQYGWVPDDQADDAAKSITWLECEHAAALNKDLLVFLLDKSFAWPAERKEVHRTTVAIEEGVDRPELVAEVKRNIRRLKDFRQWLEERQTRATFTTPENLKTRIILALNRWLSLHPGHLPIETATARGDVRLYLKWLREQTSTIDIRGLGATGSGTLGP